MKNHLCQPAGSVLPNAVQEAVGLLCLESALVPHGQLVVQQDPLVLFNQPALQLVSLTTCTGAFPQGQRQNFALALLDLHEVTVQPIATACICKTSN